FSWLSKIVCIDRHDNNFGGFLDKDRSNLFGWITFAIPFFAVSKIFSAFEAFELSRLPRHGANNFFHFGNSETASGHVAGCVRGKPNRFHRMRLNSDANANETKERATKSAIVALMLIYHKPLMIHEFHDHVIRNSRFARAQPCSSLAQCCCPLSPRGSTASSPKAAEALTRIWSEWVSDCRLALHQCLSLLYELRY